MKFRCTKLLLIVGAIACLATVLYFATNLKKDFSRSEFEEEEEEEEMASGAGKQLEAFWQSQVYPDPTNIDAKWWAAWEHFKSMRTTANRPSGSGAAREELGAWSSVGPNNTPGGRILSLAINPSNTQIIFAGSASGGIWKSTNGANSWTYVPTGFPVLGVPSIIISSSNPQVMYAGTGEVYRYDTSNIGFNVWKARGTYGIGILKSIDGGTTWTQSLAMTSGSLFGIQKLKFHPGNDNIVYAATTHGLYRTTNGGTSWTNIATGFRYVSDVVINTSNTDQIMIGVGNLNNGTKGVWRTTNGSNASPTWNKVTTSVPAAFEGLVKFAYTSGNTVYAGYANGSGNNELWRSTNFGGAWTNTNIASYNSYQFWFCNAMQMDPTRPDTVILGGVDLYRYRQSTGNRTPITGSVHADFHDIEFDPSTPNTFYVACDGGVWKTTNGGGSFTERNTGLGATQFYASFGVHSTIANRFVGGLQDNGVWQYNAGTWTKRVQGDGGPTQFGPAGANANLVMTSNDARRLHKSTDGGGSFTPVTSTNWQFNADSRTAFMAPLAIAPSNPTIVYSGTDNLHKSTNTGNSFTNDSYVGATNYIAAQNKTAITMAVSYTNANKLYVSVSPFAQGDNDENSLFINQPADFLRTTTGNTPFTSRKSNLPDRFVNDIMISPTNDDSLMVVLGGYGTSHIWFSSNGGGTWVDRGFSPILPDVPFNAIVQDPDNKGVVYAANDFGVYVSPNWGERWYDYNGGFQDATMVFDLQITADKRLVAATHGKGVWITNLADKVTLPANIIDFTGVNKNTINELKWQAAEEKQVAYYEVERKVDNAGFAKVGTVNAKNVNGIIDYSFNDNIGAVPGVNYYYRLRIVDVDGTARYSNVIVIKVNRPGSLTILGNPVTASSNFQVTLPNAATVTFNVYDAKGSLVATRRINALQGNNRYSFSLFGALASGHYVLEARTSTERFSKRIIVQR